MIVATLLPKGDSDPCTSVPVAGRFFTDLSVPSILPAKQIAGLWIDVRTDVSAFGFVRSISAESGRKHTCTKTLVHTRLYDEPRFEGAHERIPAQAPPVWHLGVRTSPLLRYACGNGTHQIIVILNLLDVSEHLGIGAPHYMRNKRG